jgi:hypothetical protein
MQVARARQAPVIGNINERNRLKNFQRSLELGTFCVEVSTLGDCGIGACLHVR